MATITDSTSPTEESQKNIALCCRCQHRAEIIEWDLGWRKHVIQPQLDCSGVNQLTVCWAFQPILPIVVPDNKNSPYVE